MKVLVVNSHPFTDKKLISLNNQIIFVSTMGRYPNNERPYDMASVIDKDVFEHSIKNTIPIKNTYFKKEIPLMRILLKEKPDIIVCNISEISLSAVSWLYRLVFKCKLYFYNEFWMYPQTTFFKVLEKVATFFLRHSDRVYCIASVHENYLKRIGVTKIKRIHPLYHRDIAKEQLLKKKKNTGEMSLIFVGRIVPYKGLDRLLCVVARLQKKYALFLRIIGAQNSRNQYSGNVPNFEENCQKYAKENLKKGSYVFLGFRENSDTLKLIKKSDLLVMPNRFVKDRVPCEAYGIVCSEGLINKVPVVATSAVGSAYDLIENGKNGFFVNANSENELYDAIEKALILLGAKELPKRKIQ